MNLKNVLWLLVLIGVLQLIFLNYRALSPLTNAPVDQLFVPANLSTLPSPRLSLAATRALIDKETATTATTVPKRAIATNHREQTTSPSAATLSSKLNTPSPTPITALSKSRSISNVQKQTTTTKTTVDARKEEENEEEEEEEKQKEETLSKTFTTSNIVKSKVSRNKIDIELFPFDTASVVFWDVFVRDERQSGGGTKVVFYGQRVPELREQDKYCEFDDGKVSCCLAFLVRVVS